MRALIVAAVLFPALVSAGPIQVATGGGGGTSFTGTLGDGLCLQLTTSAGAPSIKWCPTSDATDTRFKNAAGTEFASLTTDGFFSIDNVQTMSVGPLTLWPTSTGAGSSLIIDDQGSGTGPLLSVQRAEAEKASIMPAGTFKSEAASGANAFQISTNGARFDFGAGASDYASSDGTTVTFAGPIAASNLSGTQSGTNTGDITLGSFGSAPDAKGATLSGQVLTMQPADATHPGMVTTGAQSWAGAKTASATWTFSQGLTIPTAWALNLNSGGTSNIVDSSGVIQLNVASGKSFAFRVNSSQVGSISSAGAATFSSDIISTSGDVKTRNGAVDIGGVYFLVADQGQSIGMEENATITDGAGRTVWMTRAGSAVTSADMHQWKNGSNVVSSMTALGSLRLNQNGGSKPTCAAGERGNLFYTRTAGGDTLEMCMLQTDGSTYSWQTIKAAAP